MAEIKSRILYILKYLWQNTDAEHYATTGDILTYLKENGISCDRKTIPGDIAKQRNPARSFLYTVFGKRIKQGIFEDSRVPNEEFAEIFGVNYRKYFLNA